MKRIKYRICLVVQHKRKIYMRGQMLPFFTCNLCHFQMHFLEFLVNFKHHILMISWQNSLQKKDIIVIRCILTETRQRDGLYPLSYII